MKYRELHENYDDKYFIFKYTLLYDRLHKYIFTVS